MEEFDSLKNIIESEAFSAYPEAAKQALLDRFNELTYGEVEAAIKKHIYPLLKNRKIQNDIVLHLTEDGKWTMLKVCESSPKTINRIEDDKKSVAPRTVLKVTLPNGQVIRDLKANETFVKALRLADVYKVKELGLNSCGLPFIYEGPYEKFKMKDQLLVADNLYVYTAFNNTRKKRFLDIISDSLNLGWEVEVQ